MKTKRIFAIFMTLALSMTMLIAMSVTSFAAESYPITITNSNATADHTYTGYQVFAGTLSEKDGEKVLSNITWGTGVNGPAILTALKASDKFGDPNPFANCANAADVIFHHLLWIMDLIRSRKIQLVSREIISKRR